MSDLKYILPVWFFLGSVYLAMEGAWRLGWVHISMLAVGGLCAVCVGALNQCRRFYRLKVIWQSLIGAAVVLCVEFLSGCVLNLWLGLRIWDYSHLPGNILGQICPQYGLLWIVIAPFAIWAEDTARWIVWIWSDMNERELPRPEIPPYSLKSIYVELVTLK